jgi:hypothetical protein
MYLKSRDFYPRYSDGYTRHVNVQIRVRQIYLLYRLHSEKCGRIDSVHRPISIVKATLCTFLFSLLRIKGLYMFRALLAHPQEALHKCHFIYCVCVMSDGCTRIGAIN